MKKQLSTTIGILGLFLLASSPAFALGDSAVSVGPKLGVNLADLGGDADDTSMKARFCGGAFLAWKISDWFTFQPELLYSQRGADASNFDASIKLDYIEIPMLAMLTIPMEGRFTPNVFFGPSVAFNVSAKYSVAGYSEDIKDEISTTDVGIAVGAGVKVGDLGPGAITADIRYTIGLTNVLDDDSDDSIKNRVLCFMVGYAF
jgi:hypothetical protein